MEAVSVYDLIEATDQNSCLFCYPTLGIHFKSECKTVYPLNRFSCPFAMFKKYTWKLQGDIIYFETSTQTA